MSDPQISILMPVWNGCEKGRAPFLRFAMESILNQTFEDWELVVIDDGSTDQTPRMLATYAAGDSRIRVARNEKNLKIVRALNKGLQMCRAPLVARHDADDYSTVTRLELQKRFLDDRPETALCGTGMYVVNEEGKLKMEVHHPCAWPAIKEHLKTRGCPFVHGSVMFRKDVITGLGGYSPAPQFEYAEDFELWVRVAAAGHKVENIPDRSLYFHRDHGAKSSIVYRAQQERASRLILSIAEKTIQQ